RWSLVARDVVKEADHRHAAEPELVTDGLARDTRMELLGVDAGRDRDDLLGRDAGGNHRRAHGLAARDDPIGKPIDEGVPDGNRHVPAAYDRGPEGFRRKAAEPAVDGAMGVDQADLAVPDEPTQMEERADVGCASHPDRLHRNGHGARLAEQEAIRLAR